MQYNKLFFIIVILFCTIAFSGCIQIQNEINIPMSNFTVIGDVINPLDIGCMNQFEMKEMTIHGEVVHAIPLKTIIEKSNPISENSSILFIGRDGFGALICGNRIHASYILYDNRNGWCVINLNHPRPANVDNIKEIIITSIEHEWEDGIGIITPNRNIDSKTIGEILKSGYEVRRFYKGGPGDEYKVCIYMSKRTVPFSDFVNIPMKDITSAIVIGVNGYEYNIRRKVDGYFLISPNNRIDYISKDGTIKIKGVRGVIINPPKWRVTNAFHDAKYYLERGERVLIIVPDGFGFHQYQHAKAFGYAPFLSSLPDAKKAMTVYQSVTNAGMASIITGELPEYTGVSFRERHLKVQSIFGVALDLGLKPVSIDEKARILNIEIESVFNLDKNNDGQTSDEIFESAMDRFDDGYDLMVIHFHDIDTISHVYGPLANETMHAITLFDGHAQKLIEGWDGMVIIVADHGQHAVPEGGAHGTTRFEDMMVPYIVVRGGKG